MDDTIAQRLAQFETWISERLDRGSPVVGYDHASGTLLTHLFGRGIPAVSVAISDELMVRLDRSQDRIVGVQLEHFLARVALEHPELLVLLDIAELRGSSPAEVADVRRTIAQQRLGALMARAYADATPISDAAD